MKRIVSILALAFVLVWLPFQTWSAGGYYISREQADLTKLLAPPPVDDSPQTRAELDELAQIQRTRTPQETAAALSDAEGTVFRFADVVGPKFNPSALPIATQFFQRLREEEDNISEQAKAVWKRSRPFQLDSGINTCVEKPTSGSYPSGHAILGYLNAIVLADMVPEMRSQIFERGAQYGRNRVVCGVHFPSDVAAGRIVGTVIAALVMQNPTFQEDFSKAKAEVRKALGYE